MGSHRRCSGFGIKFGSVLGAFLEPFLGTVGELWLKTENLKSAYYLQRVNHFRPPLNSHFFDHFWNNFGSVFGVPVWAPPWGGLGMVL